MMHHLEICISRTTQYNPLTAFLHDVQRTAHILLQRTYSADQSLPGNIRETWNEIMETVLVTVMVTVTMMVTMMVAD